MTGNLGQSGSALVVVNLVVFNFVAIMFVYGQNGRSYYCVCKVALLTVSNFETLFVCMTMLYNFNNTNSLNSRILQTCKLTGTNWGVVVTCSGRSQLQGGL